MRKTNFVLASLLIGFSGDASAQAVSGEGESRTCRVAERAPSRRIASVPLPASSVPAGTTIVARPIPEEPVSIAESTCGLVMDQFQLGYDFDALNRIPLGPEPPGGHAHRAEDAAELAFALAVRSSQSAQDSDASGVAGLDQSRNGNLPSDDAPDGSDPDPPAGPEPEPSAAEFRSDRPAGTDLR